MKIKFSLFLLVVFLLCACATGSTQTVSPTNVPPTITNTNIIKPVPTETVLPTPTPGKTFLVSSEQDNGPGSLRQALLDAQEGDTISFDATIFPPKNPKTIALLSGLPSLRGGITIDASNAGVILDGSQAGGDWTAGLEIDSEYNIIIGLQIVHFSGPGILLRENAKNNIIGGERSTGNGPFGQGNLIRNTSDGIGLRGSGNVIRGNLIGTDITGREKWGNRNPGIFIEDSASDNIIGPDNIIAYNGKDSGGGVEIRSLSAQRNHIIQNNIHDNASHAIFYNVSENGIASIPQPPLLLDFDLEKGMVTGIACANCTVEFFTSDEIGQVFEGNTQADANGNFNFQKAGGFQGDQLTATSYAENQNSSEFSTPAGSSVRSLAFQVDNTLPRQRLPDVAFQDIPFSRIGHMVYLGCQNELAGDYANSAVRWGYKWMRVNTDWYDWPEVVQAGEYSDYTINPCQDKAIDLLVQNRIQLFYTITYWDPQIKVTSGYTRFRNQGEIDRYLDYVRFIVGHFKGKIQWYSILNESNLSDGQRAVRVNDYINLARQVIPVIKEIDPQAKVVIGEVTALNLHGSLAYLNTILNSDVLPLADGIAWHGGSGNSLDYHPDFYQNYPGLVDEIVATARRNGFTGQFFATELQWRTVNTLQPIEESPPWFYSDIVAGKYYARGMTLNLSKGFWITVGHENYQTIPDIVKVITSLTKLLGGAEPEQIPVTFGKDSPELRSVAFSLPDGSRLVAVWRDVKAVDDDSGVENTITLPQVQAQKVIGIDPLYAYQQELIFNQEGGLNIPGYLIRDYPTFILIEGYSQIP